jgi:hypothetical protein
VLLGGWIRVIMGEVGYKGDLGIPMQGNLLVWNELIKLI